MVFKSGNYIKTDLKSYKTHVMTTRNWVLLGLCVTAAAVVAALFTTEQGKKVRSNLSDSLSDWSDKLTKFAKSNGDGLAMAANDVKSNAARHLKNLP